MKTLLMVGVTGLVLAGCTMLPGGTPTPTPAATALPTPSPLIEEQSMMDASPAAKKMGVKSFTVVGDNFSFDTKEIVVSKGDTVQIVFQNKEGFHDWVVDEFNAKTKQISAGKEETIEFVADKTGTFEYYCSVGQHRAQGMVGKLIVR